MVSSGPLTAHSGKRPCHSQVNLILLACRADKSLKSSKEILVIFVWRWQGFWGGGRAMCREAMGVLPRLVETAGGLARCTSRRGELWVACTRKRSHRTCDQQELQDRAPDCWVWGVRICLRFLVSVFPLIPCFPVFLFWDGMLTLYLFHPLCVRSMWFPLLGLCRGLQTSLL